MWCSCCGRIFQNFKLIETEKPKGYNCEFGFYAVDLIGLIEQLVTAVFTLYYSVL